MTLGDRPIENHNRALVMEDDEFDADEYEIIGPDDLEETVEMNSSDEGSEGSDTDDSERIATMCCIPSTDHASFVFKEHTASVFCIGINPENENMVITGGEDDKAYIWNTQTGEVLLAANDFSDSVSNASFNHDGKFVSAVDMGGTIKVWKTTSHPFQVVWENKIEDVQWMKWHPQSNILLVGETTGGAIYMWKIPSGECKVLPGHKDLTDVGGFLPDGKRAIACYIDGCVKLYNLAKYNVIMKYEVTQDTIISFDAHPDNNLVALGSINSRLCVMKTQGTQSVQEYICIEEREVGSQRLSTSVENVIFSRKLPYNVIVAATDNALHVFDYIKFERRGYIPIDEGVTRMVWPEGSHTVFVGTKVGKIAVCDVRALKQIAIFEGHSKSILDLAITKDGKTLISSSDDKTVRIFQVDEIALTEGFSLDSID